MGDATRSNGEPASSARRATLVPMGAAGGGESSPAPPGFSTQPASPACHGRGPAPASGDFLCASMPGSGARKRTKTHSSLSRYGDC